MNYLNVIKATILTLIFASNQSYAFDVDVSESTLTDEQAISIGMTEVFNQKFLENNLNFNLQDKHLDLAKIVVVINKSVRSNINKDGQTLKIYQNGVFVHEFDTSTGTEKIKQTTSGRRYIATTPLGIYRAKRAFKEYQSKAFFGARMDFAVFFRGGIATHSTSKAAYRKLGQRASGGCARLKYEDAQTLVELIRSTGEGHSRIWDVGIEGLERNQYSDRIKLQNLGRFSGSELGLESTLWTYDSAIIVVN
jgi:lipoprotein-anchoring transpeptidase ErfK/SrfK